MSEKLKIVTIGGDSSSTPELMEGLIGRYEEMLIYIQKRLEHILEAFISKIICRYLIDNRIYWL